MAYAFVENNVVDRVTDKIPEVGVLLDGRPVSGFDKLPEEELRSYGWIPATYADPPEHDQETHRAYILGWEIENGVAVQQWGVEPLPEVELKTRDRTRDADTAIQNMASMPNVREKLRNVLNGSDTLSAAQLQKVVAALALLAIQDRDDT